LQLSQFLQPAPAVGRLSRRQVAFWLSLSLMFAVVYAILVLQQAFGSAFVVQDDARQHVFWMQRFVDANLFPQDWIADYFQSVAPAGYTWLYRIAAGLGVNPLLLSKLLPPVLGVISTVACFSIVLELFPVPIAAFVSSLLLNQMLWMNDDLVSATPRAFVYPLLLGFCYFLLRRRLLGCVLLVGLQGLFYPQAVFLSAGLLLVQLVQWQGVWPRLSRDVKDYWFSGVGLATAVAVLLPYALHLSQFDPVVSLAEAKQMPEFQRRGRSDFFTDNAWDYWVQGLRSGLFPNIDRLPELLIAAVLLPMTLRFRQRFPLTQQLQPAVVLMPQLLVVSLFWFLAAHALLFQLHLPSRYTQHSFRIVLCWAAGIGLVIAMDGLKRWAGAGSQGRRWLALGVIGAVASALIFYPNYTPEFPRTKYFAGAHEDLYQFFAQQPPETLIASLSEEANNLPSFTQRSVLVAQEYAIPYHMGYYRPFQQRAVALIQAQYSPGLGKVKRFIRDTGVDFWLLDRQAFTPEYLEQSWFKQYPEAFQAAKRVLNSGKQPALSKVSPSCRAFQNQTFIVVDAACLLNSAPNRPS
jgi:hypothetical protein